jgi:hypothetical protein
MFLPPHPRRLRLIRRIFAAAPEGEPAVKVVSQDFGAPQVLTIRELLRCDLRSHHGWWVVRLFVDVVLWNILQCGVEISET